MDAEPQSLAQPVVHCRPQPPAGGLKSRGRTC
jgi:hypothetical protein